MFIIKRNTTPTLEVNIKFDLSKIQCLEFIFKHYPEEDAEELVKKKYTSEALKTKEGNNEDAFVALVDLTAKETLELPIGEVYMDTRIVTTEGKIPRTDIVEGKVIGTFFKGEHSCD